MSQLSVTTRRSYETKETITHVVERQKTVTYFCNGDEERIFHFQEFGGKICKKILPKAEVLDFLEKVGTTEPKAIPFFHELIIAIITVRNI